MIDHRTIAPKELMRLTFDRMEAEALSLTRLAQATGVSRFSLRNYKTGMTPALKSKKRLADWLNGIPLEEKIEPSPSLASASPLISLRRERDYYKARAELLLEILNLERP